eukprot:Lithocolla_globosa_v1_NODE_1850_length_2298_cov_3.220241.p1 type:complete len:317 gc:universal NODE_1850_length_2298_cov_3.220241:1427-477(-)
MLPSAPGSPDSPKITLGELTYALQQLSKRKAPGPDGIPVELLLLLPVETWQGLVDTFNHLLENPETLLPTTLLEGIILSFKKAGKSAAHLDGFRPVTLTNSLAKLLEKILQLRLQPILLRVILDLQAGSQKGRSSREQLFILINLLMLSSSDDIPVYVAFIDFRKAFDSVWHSGLFLKLWVAGLTGKPWLLLRRWYEGMTSTARVDKHTNTSSFQVLTGTRQGSLLSPLFFLVFIADLFSKLSELGEGVPVGASDLLAALGLADDVALLSNTPEGLSPIRSNFLLLKALEAPHLPYKKRSTLLPAQWSLLAAPLYL